MARPLRNVLVGVPYHLTQRGKYRQQVFFNDDDYTHSLELLWHYARKYGLEILAYCLMPNHVHYVAIPHTEFAFARTFGIGHMCYARYRHQPLHRSGHLWQGRFFAAPLDEEYCSRAVRYVELNPLRAHLVDHPEAWLWSSAAIHLRGERLPGTAYPPDIALQSWRVMASQVLRRLPKEDFGGSLPCLLGSPVNACKPSLRATNHNIGVNVVRYSFIVRDSALMASRLLPRTRAVRRLSPL